jgi:hypothetical protein
MNAGFIFAKPDLSLFPLGCDSICDTDTLNLYIPLPLNALAPYDTYPTAYPSITWYETSNWGSPIGFGENLPFSSNVPGNYQIAVVVSNNFNCVDTAGVFCLKVKNCPPFYGLDFGDAPEDPQAINYPVLLVSNGARHSIVPGVYLGSQVDAEPDGQPSAGAVCDDNDCLYPSLGDDEDGVTMPPVINAGSTVNITVVASVAGFLDAWSDYNVDGDWADPGEHIFINQALAAGSNSLSFIVPVTATSGASYTRYRFRTSNLPISYDGLVADGEVEDYATTISGNPNTGEHDFGDVPDNPVNANDYPTLLLSNGARHTINPAVYLGLLIDSETDGQPSVIADGDDTNGTDDEDGVNMPPVVIQGSNVTITVTASVTGFLDAWIDYNIDGDWADTGEHIFINQPLNAGLNTLSFTVPVTAGMGSSYARFRFRTTNAPISYDGLVADGEVEDYAVFVEQIGSGDFDFGDAPEFHDAGFYYPTLLANNGARHAISPNICLGAFVDPEPDGQPSIGARCDDTDCLYPSLGDDEDGVTIPLTVNQGSTVPVAVVASVNGFLDSWIDFNVDGDWADPGEHIFISLPVVAGLNNLNFSVPVNATVGASYIRFRFRTSPAAISYDGLVFDGEVEDYLITILQGQQGSELDFGDAPDNPDIATDYPTLLSSNGARHNIVAGTYLGLLIDAETDGQPNFMATGDDLANVDDEDGITMPPFVLQGQTVTITATASTAGFLDAWMDFNTDGDWADPGEHIFINQPLSPGPNILTFNVPVNANMGPSYSRFRFRTSNAPITFSGLVNDGEVEDYAVFIEGSPQEIHDFGDAPDNPSNPNDYPTLSASGGAQHTIDGFTYLGTSIDNEPDGQPSPGANGDNLNNLNDEDGVTFLWPMSPGNPCKIQVVASVGNALLNMWIDFNGNGSWADAGEHVYVDITPVAGNNYFTFMVPGTAIPGPAFARFRFSHQPALSYSGAAFNGEVEDYRVQINKSSHKWHQLPDDHLPGLHSDNSTEVTDDWICNGGLVTQFDWWGNYEMNDTGENRGDGIDHFEVKVYSDGGCIPDTTILSYTIPFTAIPEVNTGQSNGGGSIIYRYSFVLPLPFAQIKDHKYWISVRAISVNAQAPAVWRWQEANRWINPVSCASESRASGTGWQPIFFPDPAPGQYSDLAFSVINSQNKTLNMKAYLQGLYAGDGVMHKAQSETGDQFPGNTADQVTVELHNAGDYSIVEHTFDNVNISTNGDISISPVPESLSGEYYITIKHRNSITTTTANPVSFSESDVSYDFSTSASKAYGDNLLEMDDGYFVVFSGDVNQDGVVDTADMTPVDNDSAGYLSGYLVSDVNGDGIVDTADMTTVDNNAAGYVGSVTP